MSTRRLPKNIGSIIPPVSFKLDGAYVTIYEVTKSTLITGETWYHVNLDLRISQYKTKRFTLDVRNVDELKRKLLIEISKFKLMILLGVRP